jgi:catechol 2,3-dioxygenase-like lactoylglutathione lyase family enzyme
VASFDTLRTLIIGGKEMAELNHIGLTVRNLDASLKFYREVVGMTVETSFALENGRFAKLTRNPEASIRGVYVLAGSFRLQLLEYVAGGGTGQNIHHNNAGSPHMSFGVPDVEAKYRQVQATAGAKIISDIVEVVPKFRSFYVEDPDGVPVEFFQMAH